MRTVNLVIFAEEIYGPLLTFLAQTGGYTEFQVQGNPDCRRLPGCLEGRDANAMPDLFVFAYDWRRRTAANAALLRVVCGVRSVPTIPGAR